MATGADQAVGLSLVAFSLLLFAYYSVWVVVLPFVDGGHALNGYFLPREYSLLLPAAAALLLLLLVGAFVAAVMWRNPRAKKAD